MPTLSTPPLLSLSLDSWATIPNGVQLLADGDMEAAGVASWPIVGAVTRTKDTTLPHSGSQCLRIVTTAYGFVQQVCTTVGRTYRIRGWARSVTGVIPTVFDSGLAQLWTGTASASWQYFDVTYIALGTYVMLYSQFSGVGTLEYDDITLELCPASTRNLGSSGGVALLGDGVTAGTMPTQLSPHGMSFDGTTDYLSIPAPASAYSFGNGAGVDQPFSIECLVNISSADAMIAHKGIFNATAEYFIYQFSGNIALTLYGTAGTAFIGRSAPGRCVGVCHVVSTYDATKTVAGVALYRNGVRCDTANISGGAYVGMTPSGSALQFGNLTGPVAGLTGNGYNFAIYPWALTPSQVSQQYRKRMALLQCR